MSESSKFSNYPTPHCHVQSFDSASTPENFIKKEQELGTGTITVTDHGSMGACRRVYDLAKAHSLTPILGCEVYFRDDDCPILISNGLKPKDYLKYFHLTVHCRDEDAFSQLSQIVSAARTEKHGSEVKSLLDWAALETLSGKNITIGSGCLVGMVQRHFLRDGLPGDQKLAIATQYYERLRSIASPSNFYVELFPHKCDNNWVAGVFFRSREGDLKFWKEKRIRLLHRGETTAQEAAALFKAKELKEGECLVAVMNNRVWHDLPAPFAFSAIEHLEGFVPNECTDFAPDGDVQLACNKEMHSLATKYKDRIIISDDAHFADPSEKIVQDVRLQQAGNWRFSSSYHRQTGDESWEFFSKRQGISESEYEGWIENNKEWSERFKDFKFTSRPSLPTRFYPSDTLRYTMELIEKHGRMPKKDIKYVHRLKTEIDLLHRNGTIDLLPYFFLAEEVNSLYESQGKLTGPGRGSAAGLLLSYLLGITHIDPLKYGLSLERFLTLDRIRSGKLPDIDSDFPTRIPLVGDGIEKKTIVVTLDDGTEKELPIHAKVMTDNGIRTIEEAEKNQLEIISFIID